MPQGAGSVPPKPATAIRTEMKSPASRTPRTVTASEIADRPAARVSEWGR